MSDKIKCFVCQNAEACKKTLDNGDESRFECDICGHYSLNIPTLKIQGRAFAVNNWNLTSLQRAVLSHRIRTQSATAENRPFRITADVLKSLRSSAKLPHYAVQAANLIRYIGDEVSRSNKSIAFLPMREMDYHYAVIGALDSKAVMRLTKELVERKIFTADNIVGSSYVDVTLSLDGWKQYEAEKRGGFDGNYGFIAMQFGEADLDDFVEKVVKPAVKNAIGCDLVTLHDVATAGVIDNILRVKIRDAKFVIADLTHDNRGAYWEAGYAEGLGKPVIYICEKTQFDEKKTHFDTNHCTTVPWSRDDDAGFCERLTATLRRSLDQSS